MDRLFFNKFIGLYIIDTAGLDDRISIIILFG